MGFGAFRVSEMEKTRKRVAIASKKRGRNRYKPQAVQRMELSSLQSKRLNFAEMLTLGSQGNPKHGKFRNRGQSWNARTEANVDNDVV